MKDKTFYILKRCKTENITEADDILLEAKHLRNLEHKNIVKYIDDFIHIEINKGKLDPIYYVFIIMEFCEGGDLKDQIDTNYYEKKIFSNHQILDIMVQICEGLNYLHNRDIIHRDIKSQNIFLTKNNIIRIGDFGLAKKLKKKNNRKSYMTKVGTDCYMAPEILQGENYGKPADIWSLGCVLHELCTLNFMWMQDVPAGLKILTKKDEMPDFFDEIKNEQEFFRSMLKNIFIESK
jgi:NIMA (never in mitosis gene a)-related kinase